METSANGSCFQVNQSGKFCIRLVSGFVLRANTKFPRNKGLKVKEISIIMHTLKYEQFSAVICMLIHKDQVIAQISDNAISFTTKATKYENEQSCNIPPNMFNKVTSPMMPKKARLQSKFSSRFQKAVCNVSKEIPVFDRQKNNVQWSYYEDLDCLEQKLLSFDEEIPVGLFTVGCTHHLLL
ncbi:hypothetical protein BDQ12DRAFT_669703 [Crucibulum laeve]|uniref:Uncharacterized protein n=1 Tax=Crucibulum laeve TaxID=68775 RepID=A0A5C3LMP2_9AGAR|nr:hypothetical protein BDQ12DRAFT_669703 [Crucibulum laeve]